VTRKRKDEIFAKAIPGSELSRAADIEEVLNGPYVDFLRNVNDFTNSFDLKKLTSLYLDLTGDCYWALVRNGLGVPVNIWVLPSEYTKPIPDNDVWIKGYKYKRGMVEIIYPKEDVIHFRYPTPLSPFIGMAPIAAVLDAWNLRQYMFNYETQTFKTGGNPKMIMLSKGNVSKAEANKLKNKYKNTEAGGVAVMGGQDFEFFQPQSFNARDMGYREGIALTRDEIAAAYHVPKSMLTADDVNLATATAQKFFLAEYATSPSVAQIDQKMNEQLSPQFSEQTFVLFDDPVPENREEARADMELQVSLGIISRKEARNLLAMGEPDGELLVPDNIITLEQAEARPAPENGQTELQMVGRVERIMDIIKAKRSGVER
jgi:HK97 family phage portal protein